MSPLTFPRLSRLAAILIVAPGAAASCAEKPRVLVVDFVPKHGATELLCREVADSLALELMDAGSYEIIPRSQLEQEMSLRYLKPPLDRSQALKLAGAVRADLVLTGELEQHLRDTPLGVRLTLLAEMVDVPLQYSVTGAAAVAQAEPAAGEEITRDALRLRAITQVCKQAAGELRSQRPVTGHVLIVDGQGNLHLDLGQRDGLRKGSKVVLLRTEVNPKTATQSVLRVGEARITSISSRDSMAVPLAGCGRAKSLDKVRVVYEHPKKR